jgi:DNA repair exonuclease SbcCD ATPase subunit
LKSKIKDLEASLEKKDFLLQAVEGSLVEAQSQNTKLSEELDNARTILNKKSERFDQEIEELQSRAEAEAEKNTKLCESMKDLRNKCTDFATRCVNRLKGIFNSVGATSEEIAPSAEDIPKDFDHIENEVEALDEVIAGHRDFCALLASRGTATAFLKARCTHAKRFTSQPLAFQRQIWLIFPLKPKASATGSLLKFGQRAAWASWRRSSETT